MKKIIKEHKTFQNCLACQTMVALSAQFSEELSDFQQCVLLRLYRKFGHVGKKKHQIRFGNKLSQEKNYPTHLFGRRKGLCNTSGIKGLHVYGRWLSWANTFISLFCRIYDLFISFALESSQIPYHKLIVPSSLPWVNTVTSPFIRGFFLLKKW